MTRRKHYDAQSVLQQEEGFGYSSWRGLNWKYEREEKGFPQGMPKTWEYSYRYNAMSERESKREWSNPGGDGTAPGYAWTYYLLGGTKEQLSVWQGTQTSEVGFCGSTGGSQVYFYPTEYLTYGGRSANIITHPNGTQEYRIADHLGSNRVTLDGSGVVTNTYDYEPFGGILSSGGEARQGFNSREKDQESDLFNNGVRKLDDNIGRFTSIDPLWEKFPSWSPYQYGYNNPLRVTDPGGMQGRTPITPQVEMGPDGLPSLYGGLHYPSNAIGKAVAGDQPMRTSERGRTFIKSYEALRLHVYNDQAGYATIGYGSLLQPEFNSEVQRLLEES